MIEAPLHTASAAADQLIAEANDGIRRVVAAQNVLEHFNTFLTSEHLGNRYVSDRVGDFSLALLDTVKERNQVGPTADLRLAVPQNVIVSGQPEYTDPIIHGTSWIEPGRTVDVFDGVVNLLVDHEGSQFCPTRDRLQPNQKAVVFQESRIPGFYVENVFLKTNPNPQRTLVSKPVL